MQFPCIFLTFFLFYLQSSMISRYQIFCWFSQGGPYPVSAFIRVWTGIVLVPGGGGLIRDVPLIWGTFWAENPYVWPPFQSTKSLRMGPNSQIYPYTRVPFRHRPLRKGQPCGNWTTKKKTRSQWHIVPILSDLMSPVSLQKGPILVKIPTVGSHFWWKSLRLGPIFQFLHPSTRVGSRFSSGTPRPPPYGSTPPDVTPFTHTSLRRTPAPYPRHQGISWKQLLFNP